MVEPDVVEPDVSRGPDPSRADADPVALAPGGWRRAVAGTLVGVAAGVGISLLLRAGARFRS